MSLNQNIRAVYPNDLDALKTIIDSNELFPSEFLPDMIQPFFKENNEFEFWIAYVENDMPIAVAYYAPERMTNGTYNLYLIAVSPDFQGKSIGKQMLDYIETHLINRGERILLIETSGKSEFKKSKEFYIKNNYQQEAVIRDFYDYEDDKIIFRKSLT